MCFFLFNAPKLRTSLVVDEKFKFIFSRTLLRFSTYKSKYSVGKLFGKTLDVFIIFLINDDGDELGGLLLFVVIFFFCVVCAVCCVLCAYFAS